MELLEIYQLFLRKKLYFLIIPVISAMIAFVLRFLSERQYTSESQISTGLTLAKEATGEIRKLSPFDIAVSFGNTKENMKSKMVINRLSYMLLAHDLSSEKPFRNPNFEKAEISKPQADTTELVLTQLNSAIDSFKIISKTSDMGKYIYLLLEQYNYSDWDLHENSDIFRVGNTDFINVRYTSEVPDLSAYVVNTWVDNCIDYFSNQKRSFLSESVNGLKQIVKDKQNALSESTQRLNDYKRRYIYRSTKANSDPIAEYETLIREKESNLSGINIRLNNVREQIANITGDNPNSDRKKIIEIKKEIDRLSIKKLNNENNKNLADSISALTKELQSLTYSHTSGANQKVELEELLIEENNLEVEYKIAKADLKELQSRFVVEKGNVRSSAVNRSILENLESEVQQAREEVTAAQNKYHQASSNLLVNSEDIKLSYYGDIPEEPLSRKTIIFTLAGGIVGFVITLFMVLSLELLDFRMTNIFKFERSTGYRPDAMIGKMNFGDNMQGILLGKTPDDQESRIKFQQMIKKVRFPMLSDAYSKTILVTSMRPQTGKSFILSALAQSFSLLEKKVLIFDTNFRNPSLTESIKGQKGNESGDILSMIQNDQPLDFGKLNFIRSTEDPNIDIIAGESRNSTPEEVFAKVGLNNVLSNLEECYDIILLEGSPINSYSDSRELVKYANKIVCVHSSENEFNATDKESLAFLSSAKDKILLNVLNKIEVHEA